MSWSTLDLIIIITTFHQFSPSEAKTEINKELETERIQDNHLMSHLRHPNIQM